jgi:hypothetical protein
MRFASAAGLTLCLLGLRPASAALAQGTPAQRAPDNAGGHAATPAGPAGARAAADPTLERYLVQAREIADYLLRTTIGIATVSVGVNADNDEETPVIYTQDGNNRFNPSGKLLLRGTRPISAYVVGTDPIVVRSRAVVRRFPVVERKGDYLRMALDPSGQRTEWLRRTPEGDFPTSVDLVDFGDGGSYRCHQLDAFYLTGAHQRKLFEKPEKDANFQVLTDLPGKPGYLDGDLVPLQRKGNYFEVAVLKGLNDQRASIGWVELKDDKGRLTLWFSPGPDC